MSMKTTLTRAAQALDFILNAVNNNPDPGTLCLYSGLPSDSLDDPPNGDLLAECVLIDGTVPAFANATLTDPVTAVGYTDSGMFAVEDSILMSGTAQSFRLLDYADNPVLQGSVGTDDADLILEDTNLLMGNNLIIPEFDVTSTVGL